MDECPICCNTFNKACYKTITCRYCGEKQCGTCMKSTLTINMKDLGCISCGKSWSRVDAIKAGIDQTWLYSSYKLYRENILLQRAQHDLDAADTEIYLEKSRQDYIKELTQQQQTNAEQRVALMIQLKQQITRPLKTQLNVLKVEADNLKNALYILNSPGWRSFEPLVQLKVQKTVGKVNLKCPKNTCTGRLNDEYTCIICDANVCDKCWEVKETTHECDTAKVASVDEIKASSKNCPNCSVCIYRSEGCNTMFCVNCKMGFNWDTLAILGSINIGNPHYQEWANRNFANISCLDIPNPSDLTKVTPIQHQQKITDICTFLHFVKAKELSKYIQRHTNIALAIQYRKGSISKRTWAEELHKADKLNERNDAMNLLLDMFINCGAALLVQLKTGVIDSTACLEQLMSLRDYVNAELIFIKSCFESQISFYVTY